MTTRPQSPLAAVVGTIHSPAALREALRLKAGAVDLLEVRVDHFTADLAPLRRALPRLKAPLIITVRHPAEGGAAPLSPAERGALYREFLPAAAFIDVELRSMQALASVWEGAASRGIQRIVSWHDFKSTPSLTALEERWNRARGFAPTIVKFATRTRTRTHLATLVTLLSMRPARPATSLMGMREFGKISRLTLAACGSALNYGFLGELQVPGQFHAVELKKCLISLGDSKS
jgi:3-dehydroquinate dehydratase I